MDRKLPERGGGVGGHGQVVVEEGDGGVGAGHSLVLLLKGWLVGAVVQVDGVHRRSLHGGQAHLVRQVRHPLHPGQDDRVLAPH